MGTRDLVSVEWLRGQLDSGQSDLVVLDVSWSIKDDMEEQYKR